MKKISLTVCLLVSVLIFTRTIWGEVYPNKPITVIQPFGVGGSSDILIRGVSPYLIKELKTPIVIQNIPGAGGVIGYSKFYNSRPDGYTIAFGNFPTPYTAELNSESSRYRTKNFVPISAFGTDYFIVAIHPDSFQNFEEFMKAAHARPLRLGVTGVGTAGRGGTLSGNILQKTLGVQFNQIPFESGAASMTALAGNHIDVVMTPSSSAAALVRAKKAKLLFVYANKRRPKYPQIPALKELGYNAEAYYLIYGTFAPPNISQERLNILDAAFGRAVTNPSFVEWMQNMTIEYDILNAKAFKTEAGKMMSAIDSFQDLVK